MKPYVLELVEDLEALNFTVAVGDGWINVARPDGMHCEFYPCFDASSPYEAFTATYTIDGESRDLDFFLPYDRAEMIHAVAKILEVKI